MVTRDATTADEYVEALDARRAEAVGAVRRVVLENLPDGYVETIQHKMIAYIIPFDRYLDTYNKHPLVVAALASQKNYISLHLNGVYADPDMGAWFREAYAAAGKKLDMGKACVRFRTAEDLPLEVIGAVISRVPVDRFIACYEAARRK